MSSDRDRRRLVKILHSDRMPLHGGRGQWPEPGEWREVEGELIPCENGLHVCTIRQAVDWLGPCIWDVEVDGECIDHDNKIIVSRARLIRQYETWNDTSARLFAADCAEHVLHLFEQQYPDDTRPRDTVAVVRRHVNGEATDEELAAARDAAWAAAGAAARDAARDAAWDAARDAAWAAARAAAGAAAWAAAWAAAGAAAGAAERDWQAERLRQFLDGEVTIGSGRMEAT